MDTKSPSKAWFAASSALAVLVGTMTGSAAGTSSWRRLHAEHVDPEIAAGGFEGGSGEGVERTRRHRRLL